MSTAAEVDVVNNSADLTTKRWLVRFGPEFIDIDLAVGWNLVSTPLTPDDPLVASVFPGCTVYAYDATAGSYYTPSIVEAKRGYWVYTGVVRRLCICGSAPADGSVALVAGWNLIGPIRPEAIPGPPVISTYGYNAVSGSYYTPSSCNPRHGYWMYASSATTIWTGGAGASQGLAGPAKMAETTAGTGWQFTLEILQGDGSPWYEGGWAFGTYEGATDAFDEGVDNLAAPAMPDGTRICFEVGSGLTDLGKLQTDKRATGAQSTQWKLWLRVAPESTWRMTWTPGDIPPLLTTMTIRPANSNWEPTGDPIDMMIRDSIDVVNDSADLATRRFLIEATRQTTERVVTAAVELEGYSGSPGAVLTLRFAFTDAGGTVLERRNVQVAYTNGRDTETVVLDGVPEGAVRVSCKEIQHFLRRRVDIAGTGPNLTADFTGENKLLGGDLRDDNFIELLDFAQFLRDFGRPDRPESDINGDGVVDTIEFGYIGLHFFQLGDPE